MSVRLAFLSVVTSCPCVLFSTGTHASDSWKSRCERNAHSFTSHELPIQIGGKDQNRAIKQIREKGNEIQPSATLKEYFHILRNDA